MITGLRIENFKGVSEQVALEIKPITLLFGANSAGKSTILQALGYFQSLHQFDSPGSFEDRRSEERGAFSYWDLVHGHDIDRRIRLGVTIDSPPAETLRSLKMRRTRLAHSMPGKQAGAQMDLFASELFEMVELEGVQQVSVDIFVRWSHEYERVLVDEYRVAINGQQLTTLSFTDVGQTSEPQAIRGTVSVEDVNWSHALLDGQGSHEKYVGVLPLDVRRRPQRPVRGGALNPFRGLAFAYGMASGPAVARSLARLEVLLSVVEEVVFRAVSSYVQVGPIRSIPPRDYLADPLELRGDWSTGMAAWQRLHRAPDEYLDEVGQELRRLGLGYSLRRLGSPDIIQDILPLLRKESGLRTAQAGRVRAVEQELRRMLANPAVARSVVLVEDSTGLELHPSDVGTGISQVLPVVVAAMRRREAWNDELVVIQQPELHVHPAVQVELGDLFAREAQREMSRMLVETHSEHLVLRLLRRIRETTDSTLPDGAPSLDPEKLAVVYVERGRAGGVQLTPLRVDPSGEFLDPWPRGFFEERHRELF